MRILIVEDDVRLQDSVAGLLRDAGYAVDVSADGVEGLYYGEEFLIDITKPFHPEELKARVSALLRRAAGHAHPELDFGPLHIDLAAQRVRLDGSEVELTTYEYKVLEFLAMHPDQVVTKTDLSEHIYEEDADRDSNVIEVFIGRLRRKLDPDGGLRPIETLRGRGYRLNAQRLGDA